MKKITVASVIFMGLAHIVYLKQYIKGILFALMEIVFLVLSPTIIAGISNMITLGTPKPDLPVTQRDNSIFMLIDGVMILALVLLFVFAYVISIRSARSIYSDACLTGGLPKNKSFFSDLANKAFPIVSLSPAVLLLLFLVIVPLIFSALVAFTNYSSPEHIPPKSTVDWVGFDNFVSMFGGDAKWTSALGRVAIWTLVWGVLATVTCYAGGMFIAVLLHQNDIKIKPVFRMIFICLMPFLRL